MISLLAIVGLFFILWHVSKGLKKIGEWCDAMAEIIADRPVSVSVVRYKRKRTPADLEKAGEKTRVFQDGEDKAYNARIQKEIEKLTQGETE